MNIGLLAPSGLGCWAWGLVNPPQPAWGGGAVDYLAAGTRKAGASHDRR